MDKIYSFGHSNRNWEEFTEIIDSINFDYLVDVRSRPYSRYFPHFNKKGIESQLGKKYIFMGDTLGGMDENISFAEFNFGVTKLSKLAKDHTVVFFCSEKDYNKCHRFWKISKELEIRGFKVIHL